MRRSSCLKRWSLRFRNERCSARSGWPLLQILAIPLLVLLNACSPFYVMRAAYEQSKILLAREPIEEVLQSESISLSDRQKLQLVLEARRYGILLGLNPGNAFTQFSRIEGEAVAYVVSAAPKDAFALYQWWFPLVGSVPYKGYFDKEDALTEARELEQQGYETWVRGTEAFSTLGWFNDPLLSTTLKNDPAQIVNTVLHESLHTTLWIPNHVDFNESLANYLGSTAAQSFFDTRLKLCSAEDSSCKEANSELLRLATENRSRDFAFAEIIASLYQELDKLYKSNLSREQKLMQREQIFERLVSSFRLRYKSSSLLDKVNNARILQLKLYLGGLDEFDRVFSLCEREWGRFLSLMKSFELQTESDPFERLKALSACEST